ncbi:MAG: hypothetical protein ACW98Y_20715 [Candidatus Thorarchaeota archaeon]
MGIGNGILIEKQGTLVIPDAAYDVFSMPVDTTQYAWEFIDHIVEGDNVDIEVDFTNGDCDIMVWWADTDNTTWAYGNNLVTDQMATGAHPEVGRFVADRSGSLAVGIYDYDLSEGQYTVTVDTRVGWYEFAFGNQIATSFQVYDDLINAFFKLVGLLENGTTIEKSIFGIRIITSFNPEIENIRVSGSSAVKTLVWSISEQSTYNPHIYSILLSADENQTFQLLDTNLTDTTYNWDSTGFIVDTYCVKVRTLFSSGLEVSAVSPLFDAGTVSTGPPPPMPNPTTNENETTLLIPGDGTDLLVSGLSYGITMGSFSVIIMVLVLTILQYRKKEDDEAFRIV